MAVEEFKVGDCVQLNSGSPTMTIRKTQGSECTCEWFKLDTKEVKTHIFIREQLTKVDKLAGNALKNPFG
jgi:uncharacterized protein YodC (DUF2158 family)